MKTLFHNGVLIPPKYEGRGLSIAINGNKINLNNEQEEMAVAWTKKRETPYFEDPKFAENFHKDFSEKIGINASPEALDFSDVIKYVGDERTQRDSLSKEEKKTLAAKRKVIREANKERYGWAIVDGVRMEIGNYTVEPNSIFMGRGKHPSRGRWKEGPRHEDIELNLSPDAPKPLGNWKSIIWQPDALWIARWKDKLNGKMKYVWPSDSSYLKQRKDIEKFDKAKTLKKAIKKVKLHITKNLASPELIRRKTATVSFLIDHCKFRVGDEKDEEEADTVGASTLRAEHLNFNGDGTITFDFIGKDSIRHKMCVSVPLNVINNLKEFSEKTESTLFVGVDSKRVSEFFDEVIVGLSAKVFRTHYSTIVVEEKLKEIKVKKEDPDYVKKHVATMANLEAAKICNHKRSIPKSWEKSLNRKIERIEEREVKAKENIEKYKIRIKDASKKYRTTRNKHEKKLKELENKYGEYIIELKDRLEKGKSTKGIKKRLESKKRTIKKQKERKKNLKLKHQKRIEKLKLQMESRTQKDQGSIKKLELQIEAQKETRDYNLTTSLKSYIDPRIYLSWGKKIDYDWRNYYPKSLENKFSWVEK